MNLLIDGQIRRIRQCRHGLMGYFIHDEFVGRSLDLYGEFSEAEVSLFREIVKPGDFVVEVGANIGAHTVFLAKAVGPQGRVLAFEPQRLVYQMLCANLVLNELANTNAYFGGLGELPAVMQMPCYDLSRTSNLGGVEMTSGINDPGYESVEVLTLDSFQLPRVDFLKVDVEGMEREVLLGAKQTIARCQPVLYLENDRTERSEGLLELVDELGYTAWWHLPLMYNSGNFEGNGENIFGTLVSANVFCLPKEWNAQVNNFAPVLSSKDVWSRPDIPFSHVY